MIGGRYETERTLGEGGMATVRLARDTELDRPVAVKTLRPALAADEAFRARFVREARLAARLTHPNVVRVFDAGENGEGVPYIVMEYVDGEPLDAVLARDGRMPPADVVTLGIQAAAGLAQAHAAGLVHRDVKPHNLLLRSDGTLKVADFGIARAAEEARLTQTGTILGTAAYLAPEQAAGKPATPATDVYALGAVLYELLTGRPPHSFGSLPELLRKQNEEPIVPPRALVPEVPERVEDVVMHALAREPAYRPADGAELARELRAASEEPVTLPLPAPPTPPARRRRPGRRELAALAAGLALVALGLGLVTGLSGGGTPKRTQPRPPAAAHVTPVPHGATAAAEARNLAGWVRAHSR